VAQRQPATRRPIRPALAAAALLAAAVLLERARRPSNVRIADPHGPPQVDPSGAARSIQAGELTIDPSAVAGVWTPAGLDSLARTYWRFLSRVTVGLIRVTHAADGPRIVLLARPFVLLGFGPPDYLLDDERAAIRWPIRRGLLSARRPAGDPDGDANPTGDGDADGALSIELRRLEPTPTATATVRLQVAVVGFHPAIAAIFGPTIYTLTQARIHVVVTHAFIRSLARMGVPEAATWPSQVGPTRAEGPDPVSARQGSPKPPGANAG
jgi:hypothetical protein